MEAREFTHPPASQAIYTARIGVTQAAGQVFPIRRFTPYSERSPAPAARKPDGRKAPADSRKRYRATWRACGLFPVIQPEKHT